MKIVDKILPESHTKRKWTSIGLTVILSGLLCVWGIYGIGSYGLALFILIPLFIGASPTLLFAHKGRKILKSESWRFALITLSIVTTGLFLCAIEGAICILMAAPIGFVLTWVGSLIGFAFVTKRPDNSPTALLVLFSIIPSVAFIEKDITPELASVTTSIEISSDPQTVWRNVIEFPQLDEPTEYIFKAGIAYPTHAKIEGHGVGAIRHCNFTTGSFVEPITIWNEPHVLKFDVTEQPAPMKELSFWDINAPHLHDYFVSKQGQFKLTKLQNGNTLLEGTTWYYHNIRPAIYWRLWSDLIIHKIHNRVLMHIKKNSEQQNK